MAERHTVDVDVVGSKPIRLPIASLLEAIFFTNFGCQAVFPMEHFLKTDQWAS